MGPGRSPHRSPSVASGGRPQVACAVRARALSQSVPGHKLAPTSVANGGVAMLSVVRYAGFTEIHVVRRKLDSDRGRSSFHKASRKVSFEAAAATTS